MECQRLQQRLDLTKWLPGLSHSTVAVKLRCDWRSDQATVMLCLSCRLNGSERVVEES